MHIPDGIYKMLTTSGMLAGLGVLIFLISGCGERTGNDMQTDSLVADTATAGLDATPVTHESLYDVIQDDERFSTFGAAIDSTDLDQTLLGPGPFTVFAPTNEALDQVSRELFEPENEDELRDLVLSHISNGEKMASALSGQTIRMLAGGDVEITSSNGGLQIGEAPVLEADIDAANGVIHVVGQVLSPSMQDD